MQSFGAEKRAAPRGRGIFAAASALMFLGAAVAAFIFPEAQAQDLRAPAQIPHAAETDARADQTPREVGAISGGNCLNQYWRRVQKGGSGGRAEACTDRDGATNVRIYRSGAEALLSSGCYTDQSITLTNPNIATFCEGVFPVSDSGHYVFPSRLLLETGEHFVAGCQWGPTGDAVSGGIPEKVDGSKECACQDGGAWPDCKINYRSYNNCVQAGWKATSLGTAPLDIGGSVRDRTSIYLCEFVENIEGTSKTAGATLHLRVAGQGKAAFGALGCGGGDFQSDGNYPGYPKCADFFGHLTLDDFQASREGLGRQNPDGIIFPGVVGFVEKNGQTLAASCQWDDAGASALGGVPEKMNGDTACSCNPDTHDGAWPDCAPRTEAIAVSLQLERRKSACAGKGWSVLENNGGVFCDGIPTASPSIFQGAVTLPDGPAQTVCRLGDAGGDVSCSDVFQTDENGDPVFPAKKDSQGRDVLGASGFFIYGCNLDADGAEHVPGGVPVKSRGEETCECAVFGAWPNCDLTAAQRLCHDKGWDIAGTDGNSCMIPYEDRDKSGNTYLREVCRLSLSATGSESLCARIFGETAQGLPNVPERYVKNDAGEYLDADGMPTADANARVAVLGGGERFVFRCNIGAGGTEIAGGFPVQSDGSAAACYCSPAMHKGLYPSCAALSEGEVAARRACADKDWDLTGADALSCGISYEFRGADGMATVLASCRLSSDAAGNAPLCADIFGESGATGNAPEFPERYRKNEAGEYLDANGTPIADPTDEDSRTPVLDLDGGEKFVSGCDVGADGADIPGGVPVLADGSTECSCAPIAYEGAHPNCVAKSECPDGYDGLPPYCCDRETQHRIGTGDDARCIPRSGGFGGLLSEREICRAFGGRVLGPDGEVEGEDAGVVCDHLDLNGTFCILDSADALPCRGLFMHLRKCNVEYNRPALNPFFCGAKCVGEMEAMGLGCVSAN